MWQWQLPALKNGYRVYDNDRDVYIRLLCRIRFSIRHSALKPVY